MATEGIELIFFFNEKKLQTNANKFLLDVSSYWGDELREGGPMYIYSFVLKIVRFKDGMYKERRRLRAEELML